MVLMSIAKVFSKAAFFSQYSEVADIVLQKLPDGVHYSSRMNKLRFKMNIASQQPEMAAESFKLMIDNSLR